MKDSITNEIMINTELKREKSNRHCFPGIKKKKKKTSENV